ncbi:patatin-like phospholipase family protein [Parasphingorhabdus flavimaris]|uniref:Patatin-like phospholipase family protein n=1 Tax=Parasphingorhabdus flavimaris TaxID=266812 RepID=A0ABX2N3G2_9SPHN|nr:cyclic nucleotide-binding and patatin-like phospholipase domain-containing protein [Parasphingorhabdus flavimaris]NVD28240.1 patatin-like phospholipase family protein [Parasphingorhabdus flavimaris]|tara:strand:+ start:4172 stop:5947 length:1776 start_codon:yes stop_codon:yes gene_type:complete
MPDLARHSLFEGVSPEALKALQSASAMRHVAGGEALVRQGDDADALYFVESGRFRVVVNKMRIVAHIEAGEAVGELAFFAGGKRTADVIATRDSTVREISREAFDKIAALYPELNVAMLKLVSERLAVATARTSSISSNIPRVIAILPSGTSKLPDGFLARLANAFEAVVAPDTPVIPIDRATSEAADAQEYQSWLAEQEAKGAYVLIDGSGPDDWGQMVCRNADALVMVARPGQTDPEPNAMEVAAMRWIAEPQRTLLLLRTSVDKLISKSGEWIDPRSPKLHHHVALDNDADFTKIARFMTGRAVGVVLAGGGALGCAHLGVIKALRRASIPIDFIGGASAGAAMGGAIARGMTVDETLDQMEAMFIHAKAMKRLTLPIYSLLDPTVFDSELRTRYGTRDIADQPINFFGVSTNLSTNGLHIHRRGPLWECVRASGSLPTILPPFIDKDGNILVDGGVLDNVPVKVMHGLKSGPNIVVSLGDPHEIWRTDVAYDDIRGRWSLLRDVIMRRKREIEFPSIVEIMSRSMVVASRMASKEMLGDQDILVNPPIIANMQILDWHLGRELAEMAADYISEHVLPTLDFQTDFTK